MGSFRSNHSRLFGLTARAKINPSSAKSIFEDFGVAKVTEAILATEDPVAILTAGLTALFKLFDDQQAIRNALGGVGLAWQFKQSNG
jgi:hypothetical protein